MTARGAKKAVQARSRQTRDALLHALEALLREREFSEIGVQDIAGRAGVSTGTVYRRFDKKAGFIPALWELYHQRIADWEEAHAAWISEAFSSAETSLRGLLRIRVTIAYRSMRDLRHLARPVYLYARLKPDFIPDGAGPQMAEAGKRLADALAPFREEIGRDDLERAAAYILYALQSILVDHALFDDASVLPGIRPSEDEFIDEITDVLLGYLRRKPSSTV